VKSFKNWVEVNEFLVVPLINKLLHLKDRPKKDISTDQFYQKSVQEPALKRAAEVIKGSTPLPSLKPSWPTHSIHHIRNNPEYEERKDDPNFAGLYQGTKSETIHSLRHTIRSLKAQNTKLGKAAALQIAAGRSNVAKSKPINTKNAKKK